jgi:hypothetical protein
MSPGATNLHEAISLISPDWTVQDTHCVGLGSGVGLGVGIPSVVTGVEDALEAAEKIPLETVEEVTEDAMGADPPGRIGWPYSLIKSMSTSTQQVQHTQRFDGLTLVVLGGGVVHWFVGEDEIVGPILEGARSEQQVLIGIGDA